MPESDRVLRARLRLCRAVDSQAPIDGRALEYTDPPLWQLRLRRPGHRTVSLVTTKRFATYVEFVQLIEHLRKHGTAAERARIAAALRRRHAVEQARLQRHAKRVAAKILQGRAA